MSTHNICFYGEIRKIAALLDLKKEKKASYQEL